MFTPAEERLLPFLSEGLTNAEIAVRTGLSVNTVHTHIANMLSKSGAGDRRELARVGPTVVRRSSWQSLAPLRLVGASVIAVAAATSIVALAVSGIAAVRSGDDPSQLAVPSLATELADRPLALPPVAPGASCPQSDVKIVPNLSAARGPGPAYLVLGTGSFYVGGNAAPATPYEKWGQAKAILALAPSYNGRVLVRGNRIDGIGPILFSQAGGGWSDAMTVDLLPGDSEWSSNVFTPIVAEPGCYGIQVDGQGFSEVIVFEAVFACADRGAPPAPAPKWPACP